MEKQSCWSGEVEKIKMLTFEASPLVRFTLTKDGTKEYCFIKKHSLNFLFDVTEGNSIVLYGKRNKRDQVVVTKYFVKNPATSR